MNGKSFEDEESPRKLEQVAKRSLWRPQLLDLFEMEVSRHKSHTMRNYFSFFRSSKQTSSGVTGPNNQQQLQPGEGSINNNPMNKKRKSNKSDEVLLGTISQH